MQRHSYTNIFVLRYLYNVGKVNEEQIKLGAIT